MHDGRFARSDHVVTHRKYGHPDPAVTNRMHASLRGEKPNHRHPNPSTRWGQFGTSTEVVATGDQVLTHLDRFEDLDKPRGAEVGLRADPVRPQDRVGPPGDRVARRDMRGLVGADLEFRTLVIVVQADDPEPSLNPPVRCAKSVAVQCRSVERGEVYICNGRFG